jgi:hypothetical protein
VSHPSEQNEFPPDFPRAAALTFAEESTAALADPTLNKTADKRAAVATYQLLLTFPVEYMSRTTRTELVRRAINADMMADSSIDPTGVYSALTVVRVFIHNVSLYVGSVDQPVSYFNYTHPC